jgi:hypothetical protein
VKALIKFEAVRHGRRETIEVDYDSADPPSIWVEIRAAPDSPRNGPGRVDTRVYKLKVGLEGGLSLK